MLNLRSKLKWPPKEAKAFSKAIQDRFKARTPKGKQDHFLRITDVLSGFVMNIPFTSKEKAREALKLLNTAKIPPEAEIVSKPKLEEGEYIPS